MLVKEIWKNSLSNFKKARYIQKFVLKNDIMLFTRKLEKEFKKANAKFVF